MPFSSSQGKMLFEDWMFHMLAEKKIASVLDIGAGAGVYSGLLDEAMEKAERFNPTVKADARVEAIEPFHPYIERFDLCKKYMEVHNMLLDEYLNRDIVPDFDLVIMGDVLEHMPKQIAIDSIMILLQHSKFVWISLPLKKIKDWMNGYKQDKNEWKENGLEQHLYDWELEEFLVEFSTCVIGVFPFTVIGIFLLEGKK